MISARCRRDAPLDLCSGVADIELIGVPFDGYGRPGNQALAADALRDAGLLDAFEHHHVVGDDDLDLPAA